MNFKAFLLSISVLTLPLATQPAHAQEEGAGSDIPMECSALHHQVNALLQDDQPRFGRTVCADIVAMDQMIVYNRFGSFNPFGMMYALRRDVVSLDVPVAALTADQCDKLTGVEGYGMGLQAGNVRLKDCKRARPLTLRANAGDILHIRLTNLLRPLHPDTPPPQNAPDFSRDFCHAKSKPAPETFAGMLRAWVSWGDETAADHREVSCVTDPHYTKDGDAGRQAPDWPVSRGANLAIQGLTAFSIVDGRMVEAPDACKGLGAIRPGKVVDCLYLIDREGPFFMASTGAPAGGEGDGGSLTHGLFGAVLAEPMGTSWYRSQLTKAGFDEAFPPARDAPRHARKTAAFDGVARYETEVLDENSNTLVPVLNMLRTLQADVFELVHADLNAVVHDPAQPEKTFREFSVFFHDELKTFYPRNFEELGDFGGGQLQGVRNGFAINYGASGMGDMLLANRKGIGPAANCVECLYEEFFLTSWANGDPALLEQFSDDPSNVHHSYLNDRVVFRNFHAGPKETHVFHLHAHQWFAGNDGGRGSYLDSQTVAPQQGFTYDIYEGGLEVYHKGTGGKPGWYETLGSGNRNRTVGDSIFHCHLYPHFAQGMWELWRVHDVLEDGSRKLPDGQWEPTLSLAEMHPDVRAKNRPGSVHRVTGAWIEPADTLLPSNLGTPVPALVPLPGRAWPVLPTYPEEMAKLTPDGKVSPEDSTTPDDPEPAMAETFPGYPFYIAGRPGHRPPQAPMDIARKLDADGQSVTAEFLDGGLPRHVMTAGSSRALPFILPEDVAKKLEEGSAAMTLADALTDADLAQREALQKQVVASALALGDLTLELKTATLDLLPYDGTALERSGMAFHHKGEADGRKLKLLAADGSTSAYDPVNGGYTSVAGLAFAVNGAAPKPGAPFADPCGAPEGFGALRRMAADHYEWNFAGSLRRVYADPGLTVPATDEQISNWVLFLRSPGFPKPDVYAADDAGAAVIVPRDDLVMEHDPFLLGMAATRGFGPTADFTPDPAVVGYRRYAASAVQVDLVTNRAGWHDPQARINVLTNASDRYKEGHGKNAGRISPKITASEEPFFFRALSGECIEFRHTNELPKDLELDDFQVKTPTDTIGQHIHLVKFDVTSSDGSGNGFNYEDGTLAPGEIAARICAAKNTETADQITADRQPGERKIRERVGDPDLGDLCVKNDGLWKVSENYKHKIWKLAYSKYGDLFQTTTQRWFADPVLSNLRHEAPGEGKADRTLRTVFSHDHFGPSSIQQHGFYTALVIEPQNAMICAETSATCTAARKDRSLVTASNRDVGARKVIVDLFAVETALPDPERVAAHREFALSIADFALLYDPRAALTPREFDRLMNAPAADEDGAEKDEAASRGMARLMCEARYANSPAKMKAICGSDLNQEGSIWHAAEGDVPPAWLAEGRPEDYATHRVGLVPGLFSSLLIAQEGSAPLPPSKHLEHHLKSFRARAAGFASPDDPKARLARPVSPPARPESISVDHHDPYLVNYRGEPFPLRIGTNSSDAPDCALRPLGFWVAELATGVTQNCEISTQRKGPAGDMANVMLSALHGDPVVPILTLFDEESLQFRLIQGAQEVQHSFTVEGFTWPRNIDQRFPSMMREIDDLTPRETLVRQCHETHGVQSGLRMAREGRPDEYARWTQDGSKGFPVGSPESKFWQDMDRQIAACFNVDGHIAAQEIGISEHFEFKSAFLYDAGLPGTMARMASDLMMRSLREGGIARNDALAELARRLSDLRAALNVRKNSDTPYHFGSQDALWNGAWGLLRVYEPVERARRLMAAISATSALQRDLQAPERGKGPLTREEQQRFLNLTSGSVDDLLNRPLPPSQGAETGGPIVLGPPVGSDPNFPDAIQQAPALVPLEAYRRAETVQREAQDLRERIIGAHGRQAIRAAADAERTAGTSVERGPSVARCEKTAPRVHAAIAAVESRAVFGPGLGGTPYSEELHDENGLFMALVDPRRLINPEAPDSVTEDQITSPNSWLDIPRDRVLDAIRETYARPEPLVVNVKAGECLHVTLLNALTHSGKDYGAARQDMVDLPGDALMPGITSINTDRHWRPSLDDAQKPVNVTEDISARGKDIRPSARLAVTLPLPMLTAQSQVGRPFGRNDTIALDGVPAAAPEQLLSIRGTGGISQIEQIQFYAGLAYGRRPDPGTPASALLSMAAPEILELPATADGTLRLGDILTRQQDRRNTLQAELTKRLSSLPEHDQRSPARPEPRDLDPEMKRLQRELSELLQTKPVPGMPTLRGGSADPGQLLVTRQAAARVTADWLREQAPVIEELQINEALLSSVQKALDLDVEFKPYAFGALPIKSFGDLIGHGSHGLFGAITVAPQDSTLSEERVRRVLLSAKGCDKVILGQGGKALMREGTLQKLYGNLGQGFDLRGLIEQGRISRLAYECRTRVLVPLPVASDRAAGSPLFATTLTTPGPVGGKHRLRQFTLFWQDGLNLRDRQSANRWASPVGLRLANLLEADANLATLPLRRALALEAPVFYRLESAGLRTLADLADAGQIAGQIEGLDLENLVLNPELQARINQDPRLRWPPFRRGMEFARIVHDCVICDDSYDLGKNGISYRSEPFDIRLRNWQKNVAEIERHYDFNADEFGAVDKPRDRSASFFRLGQDELPVWPQAPVPVLRAVAGEEVVIHVVHPGGRARQRAFVTVAQDYDDLFAGFGFPRGALLAPGKALTASLTKPLDAGCYLFFDGPTHLRSGGVWGLIDVIPAEELGDRPLESYPGTSCARLP